MNDINYDDSYWDKVTGYFTELRIDSRWILRDIKNNKPLGSLRIVSHPDLQPGYLRAMISVIDSVKLKNNIDIIKFIEDYKVDEKDLEIYSIDREFNVINNTVEAPLKEIEKMFNVKIF